MRSIFWFASIELSVQRVSVTDSELADKRLQKQSREIKFQFGFDTTPKMNILSLTQRNYWLKSRRD